MKKPTKSSGDKHAVNDISFSVKDGEILGFLGPNGAGKSTTMNMITGYISSSSGTVTIDGCEILENPIGAKAKIGYLPEIPPLYLDMTVKAYLGFVFDLKKINKPKAEHIQEICEETKISDVFERLIKNLSKGYKQRVGLAAALLGDPELLILDEPTVGLDPQQIIEIRNLIKKLGERHTVILSSHVLPEVQAICERIIVINKGRIIADDTTENLAKNLTNSHTYVVTVEGDENSIFKILKNVEGAANVSKQGETEAGVFEFSIDAPDDIRRSIVTALENAGFIMLGLKSTGTNLEDIFIKLIAESSTDNDNTNTSSDLLHDDNDEEAADEDSIHDSDDHSNDKKQDSSENSKEIGGKMK